MNKALESLKNQGLKCFIIDRLDSVCRNGNIVEISLFGGGERQRQHLAALAQKGLCESCILRHNHALSCTGIIITDRSSHPTANITSKTSQSENYWKALAGRISCQPQIPDWF